MFLLALYHRVGERASGEGTLKRIGNGTNGGREQRLTQDLLDSAVRIHHGRDDKLVGTGVVIASAGQILTCAHVVRDAGIDPRAPEGAEVVIYFPQARGGEVKARRAQVAACMSGRSRSRGASRAATSSSRGCWRGGGGRHAAGRKT